MVSFVFFSDIIPPVVIEPWVESNSNRKEYQVYLLEVKAAGA
jgi:hypothetical protein